MPLIVIAGALANKPGNGGAAWTRLSWALGLARLGCHICFVEQIGAAACRDAAGAPATLEQSVNLAWFRDITARFGIAESSALIVEDEERAIGLSPRALELIAHEADLLVNISGHLTSPWLKTRFRRRAFIDLDPGYTQVWHEQGLAAEQLRDHHAYFTVGENIGTADCGIPTSGIPWQPIRQPVLLDEWPVAPSASGAADPARFTTIASWRGPYGRVTHDGSTFGLKAHEFRKLLPLPTMTDHTFEIALDVDGADRPDVEALRQHDWQIVNPTEVARDPMAFRRYVQSSGAECSVAQGIYVHTHSGWFSDRTVRYLASGKPALVQDTGFGRQYPVGDGLVPFRTLDEAARGADRIMRDYAHHARAARALAETWFDSDLVLTGLLRNMGVAS